MNFHNLRYWSETLATKQPRCQEQLVDFYLFFRMVVCHH
jgi:hypothetical protein